MFVNSDGESPYEKWVEGLGPQALAKVVTAIARIEQGNLSNVKTVGSGVSEYKIDFGPGYRIYFGRHGDTLVILLGGGTKRRQQKDIEASKGRWKDYKKRKKEGE